MNFSKDTTLSTESISAIFVITLVSLFILANFMMGFSLPIYLVAMLISVGIILVYPRSGLFAIIFLTFIFERFFTLAPIVFGRSEYKIYPIDVLLLALLGSIILQLIFKKISLKLQKVDYILLAFEVLAVIYFLFSMINPNADASLAFSSAKNYALYSLLYFAVFVLIRSKEHLKELAGFVFAGGIAIIGFVIYGIVNRNGLWSEFTPLSTDGFRILAFTHGFYLSMVLILALVYMLHRTSTFSKVLLIITPVWIVGIVGSMMRHLWISLGAALIFLYFIISKNERFELGKKVKIYGATLIILLSFGFYIAAIFPNSPANDMAGSVLGMVGNRVTSIADTQDESIAWRGAVWTEAIKQYKNSPLVGVGLGKKVSIEIGKYHDFVEVRNMHNSFLVLLVQLGIFGFGLVLALSAILIKKVFSKKFVDEDWEMAREVALSIFVLHIIAFMFQPYLEANLLGIFFWINLGVLRILATNNKQLITKYKTQNSSK